MSTGTNILQLSPEILTKIFQNLDLSERKCVRLSCKCFYDACNRMSIISQEKFVIRGGYCNQEITKTLLSCQYLRLNLEFQGLPVDTFPEVWTHCGDKVNSLTFHQSPINDEVVKNVIIHCRNLKHWKVWVHSLLRRDVSIRKGMNSLKLLEELIKQKIIRPQLETFEMDIDERDIWYSVIEKIFLIFPNLKMFGALCRYSNGALYPPDPPFAFSRIDECLRSTNIERLIFDIPSDGYWLENPSIWDLRLKEIQISLYDTEEILEMLFAFFSHQKLLEVIYLTMNDIWDDSVKEILFHILKECPNLRRLRLTYPPTYIIDLNKYEFSVLLQKRLEFLKLRFILNNFQHDKIWATVKLPVNPDLHTLVIISESLPNSDYVIIMEYFRNLKHLYLSIITEEVLQAIIKNQVNLEILKINCLQNCSDFGFTGRRSDEDPSQPVYSIRRLENLKCLAIFGLRFGQGRTAEGIITDRSFLEFVFPKLQHFCFGVDDSQLLAENFVKIAEQAPLLEIVVQEVFELNFSQLFDFCCKLKKLYSIQCYRKADILDSDCVKLLQSCPSLRFVGNKSKIFCINPFTKEISEKPYRDLDIHSTCS